MTAPLSEEWRAVVGYEGLYEVSNLGRVRKLFYRNRMVNKKLDEPKIIGGWSNRRYPIVCLSKDGKSITRLVHRLVLSAFVGPCPEGYQGAHLNGDASDSRLCNLKWVTQQENEAHKTLHGTALYGEKCHASKLTAEQVVHIRLLSSQGWGLGRLSKRFGIAPTTVQRIRDRIMWKHIPKQALATGAEGVTARNEAE